MIIDLGFKLLKIFNKKCYVFLDIYCFFNFHSKIAILRTYRFNRFSFCNSFGNKRTQRKKMPSIFFESKLQILSQNSSDNHLILLKLSKSFKFVKLVLNSFSFILFRSKCCFVWTFFQLVWKQKVFFRRN